MVTVTSPTQAASSPPPSPFPRHAPTHPDLDLDLRSEYESHDVLLSVPAAAPAAVYRRRRVYQIRGEALPPVQRMRLETPALGVVNIVRHPSRARTRGVGKYQSCMLLHVA